MEIWTPTNKRDSKKHWKKKGEQRKKKQRRRRNLQPWKEPPRFNLDSLERSWVAPMRPADPAINLVTGPTIQVIKFRLFFSLLLLFLKLRTEILLDCPMRGQNMVTKPVPSANQTTAGAPEVVQDHKWKECRMIECWIFRICSRRIGFFLFSFF